MGRLSQSSWLRYGLALLTVGFAVALESFLGPLVNLGGNPFLFFIGAVLLIAWFGGTGPGICATIVSILVCDHLCLNPRPHFVISISVVTWSVVLLFGGVTLSFLSGARRQAVARLKERTRQQKAIASFGKSALQNNNLDDLRRLALRLAARVLRLDHLAVMEPTAGGLSMRAGLGWNCEIGSVFAPDCTGAESMADYILRTQQALIVDDVETESRFRICPMIHQHQLRSGIGAAIRGVSGSIGVLEAFSPHPRRFKHEDLHFLRALAQTLSLAMERGQAEAERAELHRSVDRQRQLFRAVADNAPVGIVVFGSDLRVNWTNPAFVNFLEEPSREMNLAGRTLEEILPGARASGLFANFREIAESGRHSPGREFELSGFRRGPVNWRCAFSPLPANDDGGFDLMMLVMDITDLVQARRKIETLAAQAQASLGRLQDILRYMNEGVVLADNMGNVLLVNPAALHMHDLPFEKAPASMAEMAKIVEYRTLDGRVLTTDEWPLRRALRGEGFIDWEIQVRRCDTAHYWIASYSASPVYDARGEVNLAIITMRDITRQKTTEGECKRLLDKVSSEQARLKAIFENAPEGIIVVDAACRIVMANPVATRLFERPIPYGEDYESLSSLQIRRPNGQPVAPRELPLAGSALDGEIHDNVELVIDLPSGARRNLLMNTAPILDPAGKLSGAIAVFQDITASRAIERERQELLAEVQKCSTELSVRNEDLARLNLAKDEFLAMLAHELRNPLAPIGSALHIMRFHHIGENPSAQRSLEMIERQTHHMARMLDDLLDVSRLTRGTILLQREAVDLGLLVRDAVDTCRAQIENSRHALTLEVISEPIWVEADPARLEQIVANLLDNAIKYTKAGGQISVCVSTAGGEGAIRVRDNGNGIPREMLPRIFDLFCQGERGLDRAQGGLGIGLTLVKRLVEMHDGRIEVFSEGIGRGSDFVVHLPLLDSPGPVTAAIPATSAENFGPRRRVLLVEDNTDTALAMSEMLEIWGHEVRVAYNGPGALELAMIYHPEVILLDIGLPGMNGYQVAAALREDARFDATLIVAITGYGQPEDVRRSQEVGINVHFTKPVNLEALRKLLSTETD